jgi:hypothetical protein
MKRHFAILDPKSRRVVAMTDEGALGRVLSDQLRQYLVGKAEFLVIEVPKKEFDAYKRSLGAVRV